MDDLTPNKTIRPGLPPDARLLHCYAPGEIMRNGKRAEGKEPNETRGHHDAVSQNLFLDVGTNIGIALDGQFIVIDFDTRGPLVDAIKADLPDTWAQRTLRGTHYLFTVPDGWYDREHRRNVKLNAYDAEGRQYVIGDIKCTGYIVAPGSIRNREGETVPILYERINDDVPAPAPEWLLNRCVHEEEISITVDGQTIERDRIEQGSNDSELTAFAGFFRHRGYSATAIAQMLSGVIDSGILQQDESHPYTRDDAIRIARSASKWAVGTDMALDVRIRPDAWECAATMDLTEAVIEWWLHGFIPKEQLVLLFGDGGIGKSSWMSLVAANVTKAGGTFVHVGVEEPFRLFAARAVALGAERSRLFSMPPAALQLPRDAAALSEALELGRADFLYFDSIYSHFGHQEGSNTAERARTALAPLAEIAERLKCTILGTFHENRQGGFLGSAEMRNVCRALLHATRPEGKPLRISVDKTNRVLPGYVLEYPGVETTWTDPATGAVQMQRDEDGKLIPMTFVLPGEPTRRARDTVTAGDIEAARESKTQQSNARAEEALELAAEGLTVSQIAKELGVSKRSIFRYLNPDED